MTTKDSELDELFEEEEEEEDDDDDKFGEVINAGDYLQDDEDEDDYDYEKEEE